MRYGHLSEAFRVYAQGGNVTQYLRGAWGQTTNSEEIVEVAYDLQAGSYVEFYRNNLDLLLPHFEELSQIMKPHLDDVESILDIGTGECTTFIEIAKRCFGNIKHLLACDISWSRVSIGRHFVDSHLPQEASRRVKLFVGSFFTLPLRSKSIDVVWSAHALEPNGGKEREALREIFRVARKRVCLFEPSYENNSAEGRLRMESLGYIRDLPNAIMSEGGTLEACIRFANQVTTLNSTYAYIVTPPPASEAEEFAPGDLWACPATGFPLSRLDDHVMYCSQSGLAYPILRRIPVLRPEAAILATGLGRP